MRQCTNHVLIFSYRKDVKCVMRKRDGRSPEKLAGQGREGKSEERQTDLIRAAETEPVQLDDKFYSNTLFKCRLVPLKQQRTCDLHQTLVQNGDRGR